MPIVPDVARSDFEARVEAYTAPLVKQLPADESARALREWGAVADKMRDVVKLRRQIESSPDLTPDGKVAKQRVKVLPTVDAIERDLVGPLRKQAADLGGEIALVEQAALLDLIPAANGEG